LNERINNQIRATELRVIDAEGANIGVLSKADALEKARSLGLDLIEISPNAVPAVAKIMDYGKFQYVEAKKAKEAKAKAHTTETKGIQIKVGTGEHDLALKAKKVSEWLKDGNRVKIELYLRGREKYSDKDFLKERGLRMLKFISEPYKVADDWRAGLKGLTLTIERDIVKKQI
jgi:translation initiation factor IF-3